MMDVAWIHAHGLRELDCHVGLLLGWRLRTFHRTDGSISSQHWYPPECDAATALPHFSSDMNAALRVVEHLHGWHFMLVREAPDRWKATFGLYRGYGASGAEAICRAALEIDDVE
jgi:hypothetical protein